MMIGGGGVGRVLIGVFGKWGQCRLGHLQGVSFATEPSVARRRRKTDTLIRVIGYHAGGLHVSLVLPVASDQPPSPVAICGFMLTANACRTAC
jgi:hypothetical protein